MMIVLFFGAVLKKESTLWTSVYGERTMCLMCHVKGNTDRLQFDTTIETRGEKLEEEED